MSGTNGSLGDKLMKEEAYRYFIAGLRRAIREAGYKYEKHFAQGIMSSVTLSKNLTMRHRMSDANILACANKLNMDVSEIVLLGRQEEEEAEAYDEYEAKETPVLVSPSDYLNPDDFVDAAMAFARMFRKADDRQKMWKSYFEHLPSPALVLRENLVVYQNAKSRAWGHAAGSPLCENCATRGECSGIDCENDDCPLCISMRMGVHISRYRIVNKGIYKVDAAPFHSGDYSYTLVIATEINAAEVINLVNTGAHVRPNRREGD